jgi:hypothetical protein
MTAPRPVDLLNNLFDLENKMIQKLRIKLARWILGKHCPCYQMGHHSMVDFQQRSADQIEKARNIKSASTS